MRIRFLLLACFPVLAACSVFGAAAPEAAAPAATPSPAVDVAAYRLGVGDRIRVDVFGEPDLSLDATIDPTGRLNYPLLGSITALKKTARDLQETIAAGLAAGYLVNPDVRVTVVQYRPFYVTGQVRKAGAYPFVIGLTVEKAVALAGGFTPLASTRRIYVLREDAGAGERLRVGLDAPVLPGDTLMVEEGLF